MTQPHCPHHPTCPGCPLLDSPYAQTIEQKTNSIQSLTHKTLALPTPDVQPLPADKISGWRSRARYVVNTSASTPDKLVGFYARGSRDIIPITHCQAHRPIVEDAVQRLKPALFESPLLPYASFIEARSLDNQTVHLILCLRGDISREDALSHLSALPMEEPNIKLAVRLGGKGASIGSGETIHRDALASGDEQVTLPTTGRVLSVPTGSFYQQHPEQLTKAHEQMLSWLDQQHPARLVDLYCGVGAHGLALVAPEGTLIATDVDEVAINAINENSNQNKNLNIIAKAASDQNVAQWLSEHHQDGDVVVINPARAGVHTDLLTWLIQNPPSKLIYMSCNEHTLTRDLVRLERYGLKLSAINMIDMMPFTQQIEALAMVEPDVTHTLVKDPITQDAFFETTSHNTPRVWSEGVSGIAKAGGITTWHAVVVGKTPKHGQLPQPPEAQDPATITCSRIHSDGHTSAISIEAHNLTSDADLRQRLRAWGHPIIGDLKFGIKKFNRHNQLRHYLDRLLLHCHTYQSEDDTTQLYTEVVPGDWPDIYKVMFD